MVLPFRFQEVLVTILSQSYRLSASMLVTISSLLQVSGPVGYRCKLCFSAVPNSDTLGFFDTIGVIVVLLFVDTHCTCCDDGEGGLLVSSKWCSMM